MESTSWFDKVTSRCAHHRRAYYHLCTVIRFGVVHESPNPEWTLVVWTHIITSHKFDTKLIIVSLSIVTEMFVSPLNWGIVNVSASVTLLIHGMEVGIFITSSLLNLLSAWLLALHFTSCLWFRPSIKLIVILIMILSDSNHLNSAIFWVNSAFRVNFRQVNWINLLNWMEIIIWIDAHVDTRKVAAHNTLGVLFIPRWTFEALRIFLVDKNGWLFTSRLCAIVSFKFHGFN